MAKECVWVYNDVGGFWASQCGKSSVMTKNYPKNEEFEYCPFCGRPLCGLKERMVKKMVYSFL